MSQNDYPIPDAAEMFLEEVKAEKAYQTHLNRKYHINGFTEWAENNDIHGFSDLNPLAVRRYKTHRQQEGDVAPTTLRNELTSVRLFLRWAATLDMVDDKLAEAVMLPDLSKKDRARDTTIEPEQVDAILDYLERHEPYTLRHALFAVLWHTGFRIGSARALDLEDYNEPTKYDMGYLTVRHRPETDTPLKNKEMGERDVNLADWVCEILNEYIQFNRPDVTDDYGREPLFATDSGRAYNSLIRKHINALTRPCHYTGECPHGRDMQTCEASAYNMAQRCPSSVSPHPVRRSAITYYLNDEWEKWHVSERANVSEKVLDEHYDARTKAEQRKGRARYFREDRRGEDER